MPVAVEVAGAEVILHTPRTDGGNLGESVGRTTGAFADPVTFSVGDKETETIPVVGEVEGRKEGDFVALLLCNFLPW